MAAKPPSGDIPSREQKDKADPLCRQTTVDGSAPGRCRVPVVLSLEPPGI